MEITIHTGFMGSQTLIHIDWFDHNNVKRDDKLELKIMDKDKPRTLEIILNDVKIGEIKNGQ